MVKSLLFSLLVLIGVTALAPKVRAADMYDSLYINTLNMSDAEAAEAYGVDADSLSGPTKPTLQQLNDENPQYVKRDYDHKQQVIVGGVVMLCVVAAMVLMNNYNPSR